MLKVQQQQHRTRSLDRISGHSDGFNCAGLSSMEHNTNMLNGYEPQSNLPQPIPHPRLHEDPPQPLNVYPTSATQPSRRSLNRASERHSSSPVAGGQGGAKKRSTSRGSNPTIAGGATKRQTSNLNKGAAKRLGRRAQTLQQQDDASQSLMVVQNDTISNKNDATLIANLEQEVRSLKFELGQKSEILAMKTDALKNVQDQLDKQKRRLTTDAYKMQTELQ